MPGLANGPGENSYSVSVKREGPLGKAKVSKTPVGPGIQPPAGFVFGMFSTQQ